MRVDVVLVPDSHTVISPTAKYSPLYKLPSPSQPASPHCTVSQPDSRHYTVSQFSDQLHQELYDRAGVQGRVIVHDPHSSLEQTSIQWPLPTNQLRFIAGKFHSGTANLIFGMGFGTGCGMGV